MRSLLICLLITLCCGPAKAQTVGIDAANQSITPNMQSLPLHIGGRVQRKPLAALLPSGATSYSHQWPGVYFEASFSGPSLSLKFNDPANEYRLLIDALPPIVFAQPGKVEVTITGLSPDPHRARLEKVTESVWIIGAFDGFYVPAGAALARPAARARQIEFIGDSDMTGYGIRSPSRTCTQDVVRLTSDTQSAYPALVAKQLDADYQINAISGRGMVRNYAGIVPDHAMQFIYPAVLPDEPTPDLRLSYKDPGWTPEIIFISLGDNDFATPLLPDEAWASPEALLADYIRSLNQLITDLHADTPGAAIIIGWFNATILPDANKASLARDTEAALRATAMTLGIRYLDFVDMTNLAYAKTACDYHASIADHQLRATFVIDYLARNPDLWNSR